MRTIKAFGELFELIVKAWKFIEKEITRGRFKTAADKAESTKNTESLEDLVNRPK